MEKEFVINEYKEVEIKDKYLDLYLDCISCFNYEITRSEKHLSKTKLYLKRTYNEETNQKLLEVEKKFDESFAKIVKNDDNKNDKAQIIALVLGLIGTCFVGGATFAYLASQIILMVVLAIPGFILWALPYFAYKKIAKNVEEVKNVENQNYKLDLYKLSKEAFEITK